MDEKNHGNQTAPIGLNVLSPLSDTFDRDDSAISIIYADTGDAIIKLSNDYDYVDELQEAIRIAEYVKTKNLTNLPENIVNIINGKSAESRDRLKRVRVYIEDAIKNAEFFINGQKKTITGSTVKEKLDTAMKLQVESIFFKLSYIDSFHKMTSDIDYIIKDKQLSAIEMPENKLALKEVVEHIDLEESMNKQIRVRLLMDKFKNAPYGWNELDIAAVIATLVKEHKIRLRYRGNNIDESTPNIGVALTKAFENDTILVEKRIKIDARILREIKIICRDIWTQADVPREEDELVSYIDKHIQNERLRIAEFRAKYQGRKYPGQSLLNKGIEYFDEFENLRGNTKLFNKIIDLEEDILRWKENMQYIMNFFGKQKDIYDNGLDAYSLYIENKFYLENSDLSAVFEKLKGIIQNPIPYKEIKNIPELAKEIIDRISVVANSIRDELFVQVKSDEEYINELASGNAETEKLLPSMADEYSSLIDKANSYDDITRIDGLKKQSEYIRNNYEKKINQILHTEKQPLNPDIPNIFTGKSTKKIKYKDLFEITKIKTAADVDILTREIGKKLKLMLKNNDIEFID